MEVEPRRTFKPHPTTFFPPKYGTNVLSEVACEPSETCNINEIWLKGMLTSNLAMTALVAPYTESDIMPLLRRGRRCEVMNWRQERHRMWHDMVYGEYDGFDGIPSQLSATSLFAANLVSFSKAPSRRTPTRRLRVLLDQLPVLAPVPQEQLLQVPMQLVCLLLVQLPLPQR
jgi:hypothetical protein